MLIDQTDPLWPRVSAAFNAIQGPAPVGLTADQFAQNCIMGFILSVVKNNEGGVVLQPAKATILTAQVKVDADFASQIIVPIKV